MSNVVSMRRRIGDTITNLVTGLGLLGRNKAASDTFALRELQLPELEAAYRGDWICRKIVDIPAADMTREWRDWQTDDAKITLLEAEEKRLNLRGKIRDALIKDRLYGGSAILLGTGDATPQNELRAESVAKGGLKYVHVLTRYEISAGELELDPQSPFFGEPKFYQLTTGTGAGMVQIHPSRVVRFVSYPKPSMALSADGWGDSILQIAFDAVHNAAKAPAAIAALLDEAKIDIVQVPDLMANVDDADWRDRALRRFNLANLAKGQNSTLLLDMNEKWDQKELSFAQHPELIASFLQIAAGAADIPVTRLLGQSPKGLNATGESDLQNYYDSIGGKQDSDLRPRFDRIDELLVRSALGSVPPNCGGISFHSGSSAKRTVQTSTSRRRSAPRSMSPRRSFRVRHWRKAS
jgi:phage-related protein (TIGR01555 family)